MAAVPEGEIPRLTLGKGTQSHGFASKALFLLHLKGVGGPSRHLGGSVPDSRAGGSVRISIASKESGEGSVLKAFN